MSHASQVAGGLPRSKSAMAGAGHGAMAGERSISVGGIDLMVVDASVGDGVALEALLRDRGYGVLHCGNGAQALEMALAVRPRYAILDIALPGMNGIDVAHSLRAAFGDGIVLFAVTALGSRELRGFKSFADFDCYFRKPADLKTLLQVLPRAGRRAPVAFDQRSGDAAIQRQPVRPVAFHAAAW